MKANLATRLRALEDKSQAIRLREMFAAMPPAEFAKCLGAVLLTATDAQIAALSVEQPAVNRIGSLVRIERVIIDSANEFEAAVTPADQVN